MTSHIAGICLIKIYRPISVIVMLEGLKNQQEHRGLFHFSIHKINRRKKVFMGFLRDGEDMQPVLGRATAQQNC